MIVANCPRCFDPVRIPDELPGASQMRCPLCQAEFDLSEILDHLPPALEVVNTPQLEPVGAEALAGVASGGSSVLDESIAADGAEGSGVSFGFLDVGKDAPSDSDDRADAPGAFAFDAAASAPLAGELQTSFTPSARSKKSNAGGPMMIVKVFLGGAAGLSIAFFAILWLPFFPNNDPFGAAHLLPDWMVPASVRESSNNNSDSAANNENAAADNGDVTPRVSGGTIIRPEDGVVSIPNSRWPESEGDDDPPFEFNQPSDDTGTSSSFPPPGGEENPDDLGENDPFDIGDGPSIDLEPEYFGPNQNDPRLEDPLDLGPELLLEEDLVGVLNAPTYAPAELGQALRAAHNAKRAWNESGDFEIEERRILAAEFYEALCEMAEKVTFVAAADSSVGNRRDAVMGLLLDVGNNNTDYVVAGTYGGRRLNATQRSTDGIVIAGTVVGIDLEGELYNTRVEVATNDAEKPVCSIISRINPLEPSASQGQDSEPAYQVGSRVLICGWVVDFPDINLGGYVGNEGLVVWSGLSVEVESP